MTTLLRARGAALSAALLVAVFSLGCADSAKNAPTRPETGGGDARTVALDEAIRKAADVRADVEKRTRENERAALEAQTRLRRAVRRFKPSERDAILADFKSGKLTDGRADRADVVRAFGDWNEALERKRAADAARAELARFETALARAENERSRLARESETTATAPNETAILDELTALADVADADSLEPTDVLDANAADALLESLAPKTTSAATGPQSDVADADSPESTGVLGEETADAPTFDLPDFAATLPENASSAAKRFVDEVRPELDAARQAGTLDARADAGKRIAELAERALDPETDAATRNAALEFRKSAVQARLDALFAELDERATDLTYSNDGWADALAILDELADVAPIPETRAANPGFAKTLERLDKALERLRESDPIAAETLEPELKRRADPETFERERAKAEKTARRAQARQKRITFWTTVVCVAGAFFVGFVALFVWGVVALFRRRSRGTDVGAASSPEKAGGIGNVGGNRPVLWAIFAFVLGAGCCGPLIGVGVALLVWAILYSTRARSTSPSPARPTANGAPNVDEVPVPPLAPGVDETPNAPPRPRPERKIGLELTVFILATVFFGPLGGLAVGLYVAWPYLGRGARKAIAAGGFGLVAFVVVCAVLATLFGIAAVVLALNFV